MQLQKIKKYALSTMQCTIIHTAESGDWIQCGIAAYSADGVPLNVDVLAALWNLTSKERDQLNIQSATLEDIGYDEEAWSSVSDADDVEIVYQDAIEAQGDIVRIYKSHAGTLYLPTAALKPVERKDGVTLGLRRVKHFEKDDLLVVSMEEYLTTGIFAAMGDRSIVGKTVRERVRSLAELTRAAEEDAENVG